MSSPESIENPFRTPDSSPEPTDADLRALENSLNHVRRSLTEPVQNFNDHFQQYSEVSETILERLAQLQSSASEEQQNKQVRPTHPSLGNMSGREEPGRSLQPLHPNNNDHHEDEQPPTPQWDQFTVRVFVYLKELENDTIILRNEINDVENAPTLTDFRTMHIEVKQHQKDIDAFKDEFHQVAMLERVPGPALEHVSNNLKDYTKKLIKFEGYINSQLTVPAAPTLPQLNGDSIANIMSAVQNVAHSPLVTLPLFHGEITAYAAFKKNFEYLIKKVTGPRELWATHLANCLRGEAQEYIGDPTQWFDKYDELWEALDDKFANRWVLATDTIRAFFLCFPPESELNATKKWFFAMLQALNKLMALGMSVEEIGINFIIECLPDEFRTELRNGLRALQPGQN